MTDTPIVPSESMTTPISDGEKARLLDACDLALRANNGGGLEYRKEICRCDASVGQVPCEYCAIDSALRLAQRYWNTRHQGRTAADLAQELERSQATLRNQEFRLKGKDSTIEMLANANEAIVASAPLTDAQRAELASYVASYLGRGIQGVWHDLATGIAALMKDSERLRAEREDHLETLLAVRLEVSSGGSANAILQGVINALDTHPSLASHDRAVAAKALRDAVKELAAIYADEHSGIANNVQEHLRAMAAALDGKAGGE